MQRRNTTSIPDTPSAVEALLFLPAWGAALGVAVALVEKAVLYYSASDVAPGIYALFFASLAAVGLVAGVAAALLAGLAVALGGKPRVVLAVTGSALAALAAQLVVASHPELFGYERSFFVGAWLFRRGLLAVVIWAFSVPLVMRSRRVFPALFVAASALLTGVWAARFFSSESVVNAVSLPLAALLVSVALVHLAGVRFQRVASVALAVLMPLAAFAYARHTGTPAAAALVVHDTRPPNAAALVGARPNVIIIVLDTLRNDHVGCMGYSRNTTPSIDAFAAASTHYRRAKSVSSWTLSAHGSLFTGLWPRTHGARFADETLFENAGTDVTAIAYPLRRDTTTLAELMGRQGYLTAAIISNYVWFTPHFGLDRGFHYYFSAPRYRQALVREHDKIPTSLLLDEMMRFFDRRTRANYSHMQSYYRASDITNKALDWMRDNKNENFFLFLNYWDPHSPYNAPRPYCTMFSASGDPFGEKLDWVQGNSEVMRGEADIDESRRRLLVDGYDGEVAYMDHWIGRLFDGMKDLDLYDDCIIVVLSDHGESFGEHRYLEHGAHLYEDTVDMFLAIKHPGRPAPADVDRLVQTHDIMPALLRDLRIGVPEGLEGEPLDEVSHPIVSELFPPLGRVTKYGDRFKRRLTSIYKDDSKLIRSTKGTVELYQLKSDPAELKNLAPGNPATKSLSSELDAWEKAHPPADPEKTTVPDATLIDKMKGIGYL